MNTAKLLGNLKTGLVFIVSAPAGTGKTTLVEMLTEEFPQQIVRSISYTTRAPREGEIPGLHYHFISEPQFKDKIAKNELLEYVTLYGNLYGTGYSDVMKEVKKGKHLILVIDTQGAIKLKQNHFKATYIFVQPPSSEVLRDRLTNRKTESDEVIEERLAWAEKELLMINEYDYSIINHDLNTAYQVLRSIVIAEEHSTINYKGVIK